VNVPNTLTISRFFLTLLFLFFIFHPGLSNKIIAALIFFLGSATDWYDGYYARKHNLITNFGKILDPIADKFLVLSAFFAFMQMGMVAFWMFIVISFREILITIFRLFAIKKGKVLAAEAGGKYKTVLQIVTVSAILIFLIYRESFLQVNTNTEILWLKGIAVLMIATVSLTLFSGASFLWHNRRVNHVR
jgi:CDP-diacylglycerol--glycerol-3-phosphate 3-phosphatidyltransferase